MDSMAHIFASYQAFYNQLQGDVTDFLSRVQNEKL